MKKPLLTLALIFLFSGLCCSAETTLDQMYNEQLEASGAERLWDSLPKSTRDLLYNLGIEEFDAGSFTDISPKTAFGSMVKLIKQRAVNPFSAAGVLLGVVLLYAFLEGARQTVREESVSKVFGTVCAIAVCLALIVPISVCIKDVSDAAESVSVLMISFVPVYTGVMAASGQMAGAASYQTVVLLAAEVISLAATYLIVPLMTVSLALGLTGSAAPEMKLGTAAGFINKCCGWFMGLTATVFAGLLSLKELVGSAVDTMTGRAIKFSLGAFVPVVGSALGEAYNSVRGCLSLLKSTLGAFGILSAALIIIPPLLECVLWILCLSFCAMAAEIFSLDTAAGLFKTAQSVIKTLIGVLVTCSMFMIVATTVVTIAGRNV